MRLPALVMEATVALAARVRVPWREIAPALMVPESVAVPAMVIGPVLENAPAEVRKAAPSQAMSPPVQLSVPAFSSVRERDFWAGVAMVVVQDEAAMVWPGPVIAPADQ